MIEQDDEDEFEVIQFSDPYSGQMNDMFVSYDHIYNAYCRKDKATLVRPRLSINDVEDMVENPQFIQFFQYKDWAACYNRQRRYDLAQKASSRGRGIVMRQIRDRLVPGARLR